MEVLIDLHTVCYFWDVQHIGFKVVKDNMIFIFLKFIPRRCQRRINIIKTFDFALFFKWLKLILLINSFCFCERIRATLNIWIPLTNDSPLDQKWQALALTSLLIYIVFLQPLFCNNAVQNAFDICMISSTVSSLLCSQI